MAAKKTAPPPPGSDGELADAATAALTDGVDVESHHGALFGATRVKFVGMALESLDDPPAEGTTMQFMVDAICIGGGWELRKDGEHRDFVKMEVTSIQPVPTG